MDVQAEEQPQHVVIGERHHGADEVVRPGADAVYRPHNRNVGEKPDRHGPNAHNQPEMIQELKEYPKIAEIVRPIDCLPEQVFLLGERYAALEGEPDIAVTMVLHDADPAVFAREALSELPGAVGGAIVDVDDLVVAHHRLKKINGPLEEIGNRLLFIVAVANQAHRMVQSVGEDRSRTFD